MKRTLKKLVSKARGPIAILGTLGTAAWGLWQYTPEGIHLIDLKSWIAILVLAVLLASAATAALMMLRSWNRDERILRVWRDGDTVMVLTTNNLDLEANSLAQVIKVDGEVEMPLCYATVAKIQSDGRLQVRLNVGAHSRVATEVCGQPRALKRFRLRSSIDASAVTLVARTI